MPRRGRVVAPPWQRIGAQAKRQSSGECTAA